MVMRPTRKGGNLLPESLCRTWVGQQFPFKVEQLLASHFFNVWMSIVVQKADRAGIWLLTVQVYGERCVAWQQLVMNDASAMPLNANNNLQQAKACLSLQLKLLTLVNAVSTALDVDLQTSLLVFCDDDDISQLFEQMYKSGGLSIEDSTRLKCPTEVNNERPQRLVKSDCRETTRHSPRHVVADRVPSTHVDPLRQLVHLPQLL